MKQFLILVFAIFFIGNSFGQDYKWFRQIRGMGDDRATNMKMDNNGDIIVIGNFSDTVDFDPSDEVAEAISFGGYDPFIAKYDSLGNFLWVRSFGSESYDYAYTLHVDPEGSVFVAGTYSGTIDIDPGDGEVLISATGISSYLLKLNSDGDYVWSRNLTGYDVRMNAIKTGPQGVVCAGTFHETAEFNNEGESVNLTSAGATDVYIMTLTDDGVFSEISQLGTPDQNLLRAFDMDADGNIYLASEFTDSMDVDPGASEEVLYVDIESNHGSFIAKYSADVELLWAKNMEFPTWSDVQYLYVDSDNNVVFSGYFKDSIRFNQFADNDWYFSEGDDDIYLCKMDEAGNMSWVKSFGNEAEYDRALMYVGPANYIYLYDQFEGTIDSDMGPATANVTSVGARDNYIMRLDPDGNLNWFIQDSTDYGTYSSMPSLIEGPNNDVYVLYNFYNEMGLMQDGELFDFDSEGDYDILIMKLKADNTASILEEELISYFLYPNPAEDQLFINVLNGVNTHYQIFSLNGQVVQNGFTQGSIDVNTLNNGMYILKLGENVLRFVKR